jgi:CDP-diacylglycerol--glycerol-3-phosphate 3-phosphatidyltransferase
LFPKSLKEAVNRALHPLIAALIRRRIHPNTLTATGLAFSCAAAWAFAQGALAWAATLVLVAGLFDVLDGAVARESSRTSRFGAFLDSNIDRYAEILVFLGILWHLSGEPWTQLAALVAITGSLMVSYTKARAEGLGHDVTRGLLQRPERIILLAIGSYAGEAGLRVIVWLLAIFTNLTSVQRMVLVAVSMHDVEKDDRPEGSTERPVESGDIEAAPPPA